MTVLRIILAILGICSILFGLIGYVCVQKSVIMLVSARARARGTIDGHFCRR